MVTINPLLAHPDMVSGLLLDMDENVRAAFLCWAVVLSAFVILRIPREVLLGCLVAATATVGLAVMVVDLTPERATADTARQTQAVASGQTTLAKAQPGTSLRERGRAD